MSVMSNNGLSNNGVNEGGAKCEALSPGRCPTAQQRGPGRQPATARRIRKKWSYQENRIVMECFFRSNPKVIGYRKRMHNLWKDMGMFQITEQRLLDQKAQIMKKKWLTDLELEEIKRLIEDAECGIPGTVINEERDEDAEREAEINIDEEDQNESETMRTRDFVVGRDQNELDETQKGILQQLNEIQGKERKRLPALRGVESKRLSDAVNTVDEVLSKVKVTDITEVNDQIYCGAALVTEMLGIKTCRNDKKEPFWKRRLENQLKVLNKDLSRVDMLIERRKVKKKHEDLLQKR